MGLETDTPVLLSEWQFAKVVYRYNSLFDFLTEWLVGALVA